MKSNIREIIRYMDDTTLEKSNDKKKDKQPVIAPKANYLLANKFPY